MNILWHYIKNGVQVGPAPTEAIKDMITSGTIPADTLVWHEGMTGWLPASSQSEFSGITSPSTPPPIPDAPAPLSAAADAEQNKVFGILAYLGILCLIPLLAAKDSRFARYHANQGLVLFLGAIGADRKSVV